MPGAGKTTIARKLADKLRKFGSVKLFVSDKLRPPVYQKFFKLLRKNLGKLDFLIFDATFYKEKWRRKMRALAKKEKVLLIYLVVSKKAAILRNRKRRPKIPEGALHIIASRFEKPKKPGIVINTEKMPITAAVKKILKLCLTKS